MIAQLTRFLDNLTGRGEAAVTVPPLDGALRPNRALDDAPVRHPLAEVEDLAVAGGILHAAAGPVLWQLRDGAWHEAARFDAAIAALAAMTGDTLAVALDDGRVVLRDPAGDRVHDTGLACITAMAPSGAALLITNGSDSHAADAWQRDLMTRNASGSLWRLDPATGTQDRIAGDLAWPAGVIADADTIVVAEAWAHRLIRIDPAAPARHQVLQHDLPGYPGRISPATQGFWLAIFAPRSQLVEFVLREPGYRRDMLAQVAPEHWIAPRLRAGRSFYEPLQGGGVKQLGRLKPWAPTFSAGLCVRLDAGFHPVASLHSRADGQTHGITRALDHDGMTYAAAKGDGLVVALPQNGPTP